VVFKQKLDLKKQKSQKEMIEVDDPDSVEQLAEMIQ